MRAVFTRAVKAGLVRSNPAILVDKPRRFATREHLPFELLSDPELGIGKLLGLPTFSVGKATFYQRLTLVIRAGTIEHVRYPVGAPEEDARLTARWIRSHRE